MALQFPEGFMEAARDYSWMLSRHYPQKSSLKLVGDKFMLSKALRQVLYRGICAPERARERQQKLGMPGKGERILVDGYNVLFTVNNYLLGKHVFIGNDGCLRDAGEMRGRIVNKPVFSRSIGLLLDVLALWEGNTYIIYLDEPIPFSGRLSIELSKDMVQMGIEGEALCVASADHWLKKDQSDAVATSDSVIMDQYSGKVIDIPRYILELSFEAEIPALQL